MAMNFEEMVGWLHSSAQEISFGSYLVARGVKPLYRVGVVEFNNIEEMRANKEFLREYIDMLTNCNLKVNEIMEIASCVPIVSLVESNRLGDKPMLEIAICSYKWVCEVFEWTCGPTCPPHLFDALTGLLCGYDAVSIEKYVETRVRNPKPLVDTGITEEEAEDGVVYTVEPGGRLRRVTDRHGQLFANPPDGQPINNDIDSLLKEGKDKIYSEEGQRFMERAAMEKICEEARKAGLYDMLEHYTSESDEWDKLPYGDSKDSDEK